jgi:hypothetical protein
LGVEIAWTCNHILEAFLLDLLEIPLMFEHLAEVLYLLNVLLPCLLEFFVVFHPELFIGFDFGAVEGA